MEKRDVKFLFIFFIGVVIYNIMCILDIRITSEILGLLFGSIFIIPISVLTFRGSQNELFSKKKRMVLRIVSLEILFCYVAVVIGILWRQIESWF